MAHDKKFDVAEFPGHWVPLTQDALEERAFAHNAQIEFDPLYGISLLRHGGSIFYAVTRGMGKSA